ncbi:MAG: DUF370 domain-containing protein [Deltaproteobacteria bacterium]|nr:MAG: DUF370 domain-containing protein [Deltaproteobacteria bacterium]
MAGQKQRRQDLGTKPVNLGTATLPLGFGNFVMRSQVVSVCIPNSAPGKVLRDKFRGKERLLDFTCGRRVRSMVLTASNHLILSSVNAETVQTRLEELAANAEEGVTG